MRSKQTRRSRVRLSASEKARDLFAELGADKARGSWLNHRPKPTNRLWTFARVAALWRTLGAALDGCGSFRETHGTIRTAFAPMPGRNAITSSRRFNGDEPTGVSFRSRSRATVVSATILRPGGRARFIAAGRGRSSLRDIREDTIDGRLPLPGSTATTWSQPVMQTFTTPRSSAAVVRHNSIPSRSAIISPCSRIRRCRSGNRVYGSGSACIAAAGLLRLRNGLNRVRTICCSPPTHKSNGNWRRGHAESQIE